MIFCIIVMMTAMTWLVPSGEFDRFEDAEGRTVVDASSYHLVEPNPQGIDDLFMSPAKGIVEAAETIAFVLIVGGSFGIINRTGAIDKGIARAAKRFGKKEILIFPIIMILFGLGGTTFGMCEETLPFYMVFIPLMLSLGYDTLTGISIVYVAAAAGTAASTINPFSVGIAQSLAELAPGSGFLYRGVVWLIMMAVAIGFLMIYARKVKSNPENSLVYDLDLKNRDAFHISANQADTFSRRDQLVLVIFIGGMAVMVFGVNPNL